LQIRELRPAEAHKQEDKYQIKLTEVKGCNQINLLNRAS